MDNTLSEEDCRLALRRALGREDFHLERYALESVSESPIGFMARHLSLVATVNIAGKTRDVRFFVKSPPTSGSHLAYLEEMQHFEKELEMYENVLPVMSATLQVPFQLPIPRCFLTRGKARAGAPGGADFGEGTLIVLEDLKEKGYRLWDKMVPFDLGHCRSLMTSLARFHAPSFFLQKAAMLEGKGGTNSDYVDGTFRVARDKLLTGSGGEMGRLWATSSVNTMTTAVAGLWPERFGKKKMEVEGRLWEAWGELGELAKPSRKHTNVLCHGDLWANNIMFWYGREGAAPAGAALVDLQLVRFGPAATDLLLFLHTSTTRGFREEHAGTLVRTYHEHLREVIGEATLEELMPLEDLLDCMEEYGLFGKLVSSIWLSFILNSEEVVPIMGGEGGSVGEPPDFVSKILKDRGDEVLLNAKASEAYRARIMESYRECLEHLGLWK